MRLGLHLDLPVCRFNFPHLPHHRLTLNIFQPQYTLLFEELMATPKPWLYAHVFLPGGIANIEKPEYALQPPLLPRPQEKVTDVVDVEL